MPNILSNLWYKYTLGNKMVDHSDVVRALPVSIFILDLTPGFNGIGKDKHKARQETFKFWNLVHLY